MSKIDDLATDAKACLSAIIKKNYPKAKLGTYSYNPGTPKVVETKDDYPEQIYSEGYHYYEDVQPYYNETNSEKSISIPIKSPKNTDLVTTKTTTFSTGKSEKTTFNFVSKIFAKLDLNIPYLKSPGFEAGTTAEVDKSSKIESTDNVTTQQTTKEPAKTWPNFTDIMPPNTDIDYHIVFFETNPKIAIKTTTEITGNYTASGAETYGSADKRSVSNTIATMRFTLPEAPSENRVMAITAGDLALSISGYSKKSEYSRKSGSSPTLVFAGEETLDIKQRDIPRVFKKCIRPHGISCTELAQEVTMFAPNEFGEFVEESKDVIEFLPGKNLDVLFEN